MQGGTGRVFLPSFLNKAEGGLPYFISYLIFLMHHTNIYIYIYIIHYIIQLFACNMKLIMWYFLMIKFVNFLCLNDKLVMLVCSFFSLLWHVIYKKNNGNWFRFYITSNIEYHIDKIKIIFQHYFMLIFSKNLKELLVNLLLVLYIYENKVK